MPMLNKLHAESMYLVVLFVLLIHKTLLHKIYKKNK